MQRKTILIAIAAAVLATGGAAAARYSALKSWGLQCEELSSISPYKEGLFIEEKFFGGFTASFFAWRDMVVRNHSKTGLIWDKSDYWWRIERFPHRKEHGMYTYELKQIQSKKRSRNLQLRFRQPLTQLAALPTQFLAPA